MSSKQKFGWVRPRGPHQGGHIRVLRQEITYLQYSSTTTSTYYRTQYSTVVLVCPREKSPRPGVSIYNGKTAAPPALPFDQWGAILELPDTYHSNP